MAEFVWSVRVYYEDTDAGGVVYHAQYLNFMERARTEWLRAMGFEQNVLRQEQGMVFAVHSMQINFRLPARFNDELEIKSALMKVARASLIFKQTAFRGKELLCDASVRVACLDADGFKPKPIPSFILMEMQGEH